MDHGFDVAISDKTLRPTTMNAVNWWTVNYKAALMGRYDSFPVTAEGRFAAGVPERYVNKYVVLPLLFGFIPIWSEEREVRTPGDADRRKNMYGKLGIFFRFKLRNYVTMIRHTP